VGANDPVIININGGSDRNPDANYMRACSLNEIKFPTGGIHKYTLEPNIYSKEVHTIDNTSNVFNTGIVGYETSETIFQNSISFEVPANSQLVDILFEFRRAKNYTSSHGEISINGTTGTTIDLDDEEVKYYSQQFPVSSIHSGANTINIKAFHGQSTVTFVLRSNNVSYVNAIAGGLRVKQAEMVESSTSKLFNYSYNIHDSNSFQISSTSSGVIITEPLFVSTYMRKVSETQRQQFLTISPFPLIDLGTTQGGYVGYSEVEITENNGDNGSKIYYYSVKDLPDVKISQYGGFDETIRTLELQDPDHREYIKLTNGQKLKEPFTPLSSNDYKRGQIRKSLFLSKAKIPVSAEEFTYGYNMDTITGIKYIRRVERVYEFGAWIDKLIRIDFNIYKEIIGNSNVINKIETAYITNNNPIVKEYNFNYSKSPILLKESTELHGQKNIKTVYKYISDYDDIENFIALKLNNQYALPIKIEKLVNGNQVEGSIMKYNNFGFPLTLFKYFSESLQLPANHNPANLLPVTYSKYFTIQLDQDNHIIEQNKENDLRNSFLWDYNKLYQSAETKNATASGIAHTSFEADSKGNWTYTGTPATDATAPTGKKAFTIVNSTNNITKTGLSTTTTYIVSYWKKSGTIAVNGTTPTTGKTINGWTYYEHKVVNPSGGSITVSGTNGLIDELRLYPLTAQMTTYTYEPLIGMTSQCDANNNITYYEYDSFGRLSLVKDQDKNILKRYCYNYQGQTEACSVSNHSPQFITSSQQIIVKEKETKVITLSTEDEDGDYLNWTFSGLPNFISVQIHANGNSCTLTINPNWGDYADYNIQPKVDDDKGGSDAIQLLLTVLQMPVTGPTDDGTAPHKPAYITATYVNNSVLLNWENRAYNAEVIDIYRSNYLSGPYVLLTPNGTGSPNDTSYTDTAIESGKTYYYFLRVRNQYGYTTSTTLKIIIP